MGAPCGQELQAWPALDGFLTKPVRQHVLTETLSQLGSRCPWSGLDQQAFEAGSAAAQETTAPVEPQSVRILLAEDNEINAMLARSTLLKAGHRVDVVGNGKAAVEAITGAGGKRTYDVVLMDLHMPVMDGLDAIAAIRRFEEEVGAPPIPIMVLSADSQEKTRHAILAHGASGFVTKPLDPDALVRLVEERAAA